MKGHGWWMVLACILPLLLVFLLPVLGAVGGTSGLLFIFIIVCFGLHLLMMRVHHDDHGKNRGNGGGHHGRH
jgi:hypothetical protein